MCACTLGIILTGLRCVVECVKYLPGHNKFHLNTAETVRYVRTCTSIFMDEQKLVWIQRLIWKEMFQNCCACARFGVHACMHTPDAIELVTARF